MTSQAPEPNLQQTLEQATAGDGHAWRRLVEAYSPRVFGLLVRQCGDRDLADELTQAAFVQVVAHLGRYSEKGSFEPWLFRIAMNLLRDEMRRRKRQARPMDMTEGPADGRDGSEWTAVQERAVQIGATAPDDPLEQVSRAEQIDRLRQAVDRLPEADRQIVHLRHTAGLTFKQIAETLDEPLGTVLARGHRALAKLKKAMETGQ